jgi:hypothetical protein
MTQALYAHMNNKIFKKCVQVIESDRPTEPNYSNYIPNPSCIST